MRKYSLIILCLLASLIFTSCKDGSDDDPGPAGPKGDPGKDGNANVKAYTVDFTPDKWSFGNIQIMVADITKEIVDNGDVKVYMKVPGSGWMPMPHSEGHYPDGAVLFTPPDYISTYTYEYNLGEVRVWKSDSNNPLFTPGPKNTRSFKIVIIQGTTGTLAGGRLAPVDFNDYESVKEAFQFAD